MRAFPFIVILTFGLAGVSAQAPMPAQSDLEQLSPQAAYDQATRSLEITRRSPQNWSEVELTALKTARENAKAACLSRTASQANGQDLLDLAHLCAFGQQWHNVGQAVEKYLDAVQAAAPIEGKSSMNTLALAYDYKVQASLNEDEMDEAFATAQSMLRTVDYGVYPSEATNSTIDYFRFVRTEQALALLEQRQPTLLALIKGFGTASELKEGAKENYEKGLLSAHSGLPLHALYADAMMLPSIEQLAKQPDAAARSYAELEAVLPSQLSSEDAMFIGERRRQYLLLGTHMPNLKPMGSLLSPVAAAPENLNSWFAYATVFLVFPDWCNQCVVMGANATAKSKELLSDYHVRFLPLVAQVNGPERRVDPAEKKVPLSNAAAKAALAQGQRLHVDQQLSVRSTPDSLLEGTPTVVIPMDTLDKLEAIDFPLIVAVDHTGIIRWMERASEDALAEGGEIDQIVRHVLARWPAE